MNNEPVAWMWNEDGCNFGVVLDQDKQIGKKEFQDYNIPLYTHPAKTLTDEEIWEVIDNCFGVHVFNLDYQIALDEAREDAFELVKAILRKASEK